MSSGTLDSSALSTSMLTHSGPTSRRCQRSKAYSPEAESGDDCEEVVLRALKFWAVSGYHLTSWEAHKEVPNAPADILPSNETLAKYKESFWGDVLHKHVASSSGGSSASSGPSTKKAKTG